MPHFQVTLNQYRSDTELALRVPPGLRIIQITQNLNFGGAMLSKILLKILPFIPESIMWNFAKNYIAGKTMQEAIKTAKSLNNRNISVTIDFLGELNYHIDACTPYLNEYMKLLNDIHKEGIDGGVSLKPSMFGILTDKNICYRYIRKIVKEAAGLGLFVRLDMEDSKCVDLEIELFHRLFLEFPEHIGIVFQAYLKRTFNDIQELFKRYGSSSHLNIRLCKGIYIESPSISYKIPEEINEQYVKDLQSIFKNNVYVGIATHNDYLVNEAKRLIKNFNIPQNRYEFQMLYGVRNELRDQLVREQLNLRVYIPYGKSWKSYSIRRFNENPDFLSLILKQVFPFLSHFNRL